MRAGALRSRARIRRPVETRDQHRNTVVTWSVSEMIWVAMRPPRRMLASTGAGEQADGTMEVEMRDRVTVNMRDILEVISGPEAGTNWRVTTPPHRPGRGDLFALVEVYNGPLPEPPVPAPAP